MEVDQLLEVWEDLEQFGNYWTIPPLKSVGLDCKETLRKMARTAEVDD